MAILNPHATAAVADGLTSLRALLVVPLFWATAAADYPVAAALLAVAWWSDFFDGRLARRTEVPTRLGRWDPVFDAFIGSALLGGLVSSGAVGSLPWGLGGLILFAAFLVWRNLSLGMLVQALAYAFFLGEVWVNEPPWMLALAATIGAILILDWHRFVREVLPTFFSGIGATIDRHRPAEME